MLISATRLVRLWLALDYAPRIIIPDRRTYEESRHFSTRKFELKTPCTLNNWVSELRGQLLSPSSVSSFQHSNFQIPPLLLSFHKAWSINVVLLILLFSFQSLIMVTQLLFAKVQVLVLLVITYQQRGLISKYAHSTIEYYTYSIS